MSDPVGFMVKEIQVTATSKRWGDKESLSVVSGNTGHSAGTDLTWTIVPPPSIDAWSLEEAQEVVLRARKELQRLILVDNMARGETVTEDDTTAVLSGYDRALDQLTSAPTKSPTEPPSSEEAQETTA